MEIPSVSFGNREKDDCFRYSFHLHPHEGSRVCCLFPLVNCLGLIYFYVLQKYISSVMLFFLPLIKSLKMEQIHKEKNIHFF